MFFFCHCFVYILENNTTKLGLVLLWACIQEGIEGENQCGTAVGLWQIVPVL